MSFRRESLQGLSRRGVRSATWANAAVGAVATVYGSMTLQVSEPMTPRLILGAVLAWATVLGLVELIGFARLSTVRAIAAGDQDASHANLKAALGQARRLPWTLALATASVWAGVALLSALVAGWGGQLPWSFVQRVSVLGLVFGPLAAILTELFVSLRARALVEAIAKGLRLEEVLTLLSSGSTLVRWRVVAVTAVGVTLASLAVGDLARTLSRQALETVMVAPGALAQQVALSDSYFDVLGRVVLMVVLLFMVVVWAAWAGGRALAEPMQQVAQEAQRVRAGELTAPKVIAAEFEGWAVTSTFTMMNAQLYSMMHQLSSAGVQLSMTTEDLSGTSKRYEMGAAEQAASLNETSSTTEELAGTARQISKEASAVSAGAQSTLEVAQKGQTHAEAFIEAVERMRRENRSISAAVERLKKRVKQIGRIVEFINSIADRSDLLALSAELEGTKAGEVGRAFSLVASEMRRLAENVIESTNEIEELIAEIRDATAVTVDATEVGLKQTEGGIALAGEVIASLGRIVELAKRTSEASRAISLATAQQQSGTDQLAEAMADILGITQQSLASTKQVTSANNDLMSLSTRLKGLVDSFRIRA